MKKKSEWDVRTEKGAHLSYGRTALWKDNEGMGWDMDVREMSV